MATPERRAPHFRHCFWSEIRPLTNGGTIHGNWRFIIDGLCLGRVHASGARQQLQRNPPMWDDTHTTFFTFEAYVLDVDNVNWAKLGALPDIHQAKALVETYIMMNVLADMGTDRCRS